MVRRSWWSEEAGAQKKLVLRTSRLSGEISWSEEVAGQKLVIRRSWLLEEVGDQKKLDVRRS